MKRILLFIIFCSSFANAQDDATLERKNEVRVDVLSLVASSKLNLTYERFLNNKFSVGISGSYSGGDRLKDDFDKGVRNNLPEYEVIPFVRYALSQSRTNFYFAEVFVAANGGTSREIERLDNGASSYYDIVESDYTDVAFGGGLGYKVYFKEKFAVEFLVGFGTNVIDKSKSPDVISRVGLSVGYRF